MSLGESKINYVNYRAISLHGIGVKTVFFSLSFISLMLDFFVLKPDFLNAVYNVQKIWRACRPYQETDGRNVQILGSYGCPKRATTTVKRSNEST